MKKVLIAVREIMVGTLYIVTMIVYFVASLLALANGLDAIDIVVTAIFVTLITGAVVMIAKEADGTWDY